MNHVFLFVPDSEQLQALQVFIDSVGELKKGSKSYHTSSRVGQQELFPGSGLFLSSVQLAAIHHEAKQDCLRLFHLLFDQFFTPEESTNCVAFGKHGKVPGGKMMLDQSKVNGIISTFFSYIC